MICGAVFMPGTSGGGGAVSGHAVLLALCECMTTPLLLTYPTIDEVLCIVDQYTRVTDRAATFEMLAAATGSIEMRVVDGFGFGGKLWWEPSRRDVKFRVSYYPEDRTENLDRIQGQVNEALAAVGYATLKAAKVFVDRDGIFHLPAGEGDSDFQPIACGQGIVLNGGPQTEVPTCRACRVGAAVGTELSGAIFDLADTLSDTLAFKSFPDSRRQYAADQLAEIELLAHTGDIRQVVTAEIVRGVPAGTYPNMWRLSYTDLFTRWAERQVRICEAHLASKFPNRKAYDAAVARVNAALEPKEA